MPELPVHSLSLASLAAEAAKATKADGEPKTDSPWQDLYYEMMNSWAAQDRLLGWISELMTTSRPRLIVWDNTAHDIPWELVHHDPPNGEAGWLGALIPVIRWTSVHDGKRVGRLPRRGKASDGGLLMLEDESLQAADPKLFRPYLVEEPFKTLKALLHRLDRPAPPLGLLMIRCHGHYSSQARKFALGGCSLNRVTAFSMTTLRDYGTPVLLNACSSGRTIQDTNGVGMPVRSFVELFLRKGADAVIAVTGDVGVDHSEDFAARLMGDASSKATNLAVALQQHRCHYAHRTREPSGGEVDSRSEEDFKRFFAAFLYVYYGHQDATVRMQRCGEGRTG